MNERKDILPDTSFAELAATLLLFINRDAAAGELTDHLIAGIEDDGSRRSLSLAHEQNRKETARMAALYHVIIALEPYEGVVRALIEQLYRQLERGPSAAA